MKDGAPAIETPDAGEVVWRDDRGVTCRRWNWRQGSRTRIEPSTSDVWFVIEALAPMPDDALLRAGMEFAVGLRTLSPGCVMAAYMVTQAGLSACDLSM